MKFSVIIPTFNAASFIAETLHSVLAQTSPAYEIIVVDDGSTDGTPELVRAIAPEARLILQTRSGVCGARNAGVNAASGDIIAFLDHDDIWSPWALEVYATLFMQFPDSVAAGGRAALFYDGKVPWMGKPVGRVVQTYDARRICLESGFTLPSALAVKKSAFESCGGFQVKAVEEGSSEDWDICFRLGKIGVLVRTLDAVTAFRLHPGNTSKTQQYSAALRYTCDFKSITRYWVLKCHELGMNRRSARAMFANRYMIRHFDLCDDHRYWCALIWLVRSMVVWPTKLDSYRYSTPFIRLKRLLVMPMLMFKRVAVN